MNELSEDTAKNSFVTAETSTTEEDPASQVKMLEFTVTIVCQNQIVFTIFRLISNRTEFRLVPNQSGNGKYNLISI